MVGQGWDYTWVERVVLVFVSTGIRTTYYTWVERVVRAADEGLSAAEDRQTGWALREGAILRPDTCAG